MYPFAKGNIPLFIRRIRSTHSTEETCIQNKIILEILKRRYIFDPGASSLLIIGDNVWKNKTTLQIQINVPTIQSSHARDP